MHHRQIGSCSPSPLLPGKEEPVAQPYDRSGKWLLDHHGAAILRLANLTDIVSCQTRQPEVVQPRQTPDGLLEVRFAGRTESDWFLIEIATDPERRNAEQVLRGALLFFLDRDVVPEVLTLVLRPKGGYRVPGTHTRNSRLQLTRIGITWRVVELWTLSAEALLAVNDVGLIPWVPLCHYEGPVEPILRQCRERIDQLAKPGERENFLAVTQVLMRMWYNDPAQFAIFGGREIMIESPLIDEIVQERLAPRLQKMILRVLAARHGAVPPDITAALQAITADSRLDELTDWAARCPDFNSFRARLASSPT
jgi:hypothetical protein